MRTEILKIQKNEYVFQYLKILEFNRSLRFPSSFTLKVNDDDLPIDWRKWTNKLWKYNSKNNSFENYAYESFYNSHESSKSLNPAYCIHLSDVL